MNRFPSGSAVVFVVLACAVPFLAPASVYADELRVSTLAGGSWAASVATLEADVHGQGQAIPIVVDDALGQRVPCGRYQLVLDRIGASAFVVGSCDPATSATPVTLVRRAALFDESDTIPRPLPAGVSAIEMLHGGEAGGAGMTAGSTLHCTIDVHPYIQDLEHDQHVFLSPGRYALRPTNSSIQATARPDGWTLSTTSTGTLTVEYDVVDTARNVLVLHDRATLSCATTPAAPPVPPPSMPSTAGTTWNMPTVPFIAPVRGAAEIDGVGRPLSAFADLPRDSSEQQPSPWVRSRATQAATAGNADYSATPAAEAVGFVVVDSSDANAARRQLFADALRLGADGISNVSIVPTGAGVHATALAVRSLHGA